MIKARSLLTSCSSGTKGRGVSSRRLTSQKAERSALGVLLGASALTCTLAARADLEGDADTLRAVWARSGQVARLRPELLERGSLRPIYVPRSLLAPTPDCTTVAVLGSPTTSFVLRFLPLQGAEPIGEQMPEASTAGAAQVTRCGPHKSELFALAVEMRSPRAVLETLIARSPSAPVALRRALPHRDAGPVAPFVSAGRRPVSIALSERARRFEERARREGGKVLPRSLLDADGSGSGESVLRLDAGCHRLDLLGVPDPPRAERSIDIDAELVAGDSEDPLASDATESADASLSACLGEPAPLKLRFTGSLPGVGVVLVAARWPLPAGLPRSWGPTAQSRMFAAFGTREARALTASPVYESLGVAGVTALPMPVEPGACYLLGLTSIRASTASLAISAKLDALDVENQTTESGPGTSLSFCARTAEPALIEVDARSAGTVWLLAAWQTSSVPIGEVRQ